MQWKNDTYSGWGRALKAHGELARPERISALEEIFAEGPAPAIGARRSYGDAALNTGGKVVDMTRLDRLLGFDEKTGVVEVEAGVTLGDLLAIFVPRGWMPAVVPGTGFATVGGAIAFDVHGKNHHQVGSFGAHVESFRLIQADGKAKTVSAKRDTKLFKATLGGLGQTGVIESAKLKLALCPSTGIEVVESRIGSLSEMMRRMEDSSAPFTVAWVDALATGDDLGRGILEEGRFPDPAQDGPRPKRAKSVPVDAPGFAMSKPVVRAFNAAYLRRIPEAGRISVQSLADFLFPLDAVHDWNRLYGKKGFHQFQAVVPDAAAGATLDAMLSAIAESGLAAPTTSLKRMGPGRSGQMSFPMEGWSLAVDFANSTRARGLIGQLGAMAGDAGGRIYLAKDALALPSQVEAMYAEIDAWREVVNAADPDRVFATDMVRRLGLRGRA